MINEQELYFLKLGGSLITDKNKASTASPEIIHRIGNEIRHALNKRPKLQLVIGHGSGSFGHQVAKKYNTRAGVHSEKDWHGFIEVWQQANALNRIVVDILSSEKLPVVSFPPSSSIETDNGKVINWNINLIQSAIKNGIIPIVQGDVVIDKSLGGTIISTEEVFAYLAKKLTPTRILLAGREEGVWEDFPTCTKLIKKITVDTFPQIVNYLTGSNSTDVTGGMLSKVEEMLTIVKNQPDCEIEIFSGLVEGGIGEVLLGGIKGTRIL